MSDQPICVSCDCVHKAEDSYFSMSGAGPFCSECWDALTDADQSLLLEKRIEQYEKAFEEIKSVLEECLEYLGIPEYPSRGAYENYAVEVQLAGKIREVLKP